MIYEYQCKKCQCKFDVVKHHSKYKDPESCTTCGHEETQKLISPIRTAKMVRSEYNPGLGCIVKNERHKKEIMKKNNLIEVGNEKTDTIHKESNKTLNKNLSYDGII